MDLNLIREQAPDGATHYHQGNDTFRPHYARITDGHVEQWITFAGTSGWSDIPAKAPLTQYIALHASPKLAFDPDWFRPGSQIAKDNKIWTLTLANGEPEYSGVKGLILVNVEKTPTGDRVNWTHTSTLCESDNWAVLRAPDSTMETVKNIPGPAVGLGFTIEFTSGKYRGRQFKVERYFDPTTDDVPRNVLRLLPTMSPGLNPPYMPSFLELSALKEDKYYIIRIERV